MKEVRRLGWEALDVVLITGDSYIDSPFIGIAVIGKVLMNAGFRVGIIAQPDIRSDKDIRRLGEPELFWGISGGCVDSMVANYTALKKRRKSDDFTPGGINDHRPDRAVIVYSNLIRRCFKPTRPIVLGGIESSLRRIAHYDFWSNRIRRSILFDAKADLLLYGMAENSVLELAHCIQKQKSINNIRGLCYIAGTPPPDCIELPSFEDATKNKQAFIDMFHTFYQNNDPLSARGLIQRHGNRYLVQNPPAFYLSLHQLDAVYNMDFERTLHPFYKKAGPVRALDTIRFSITSHRGCYGECNFCAIALHEGRTVRWRSEASIVKEAETLSRLPDFKGYILDVGGPTANMYGFECPRKIKQGACSQKRCLFPTPCASLPVDHGPQIRLLKRLRQIKGVKKVFVSSGVRHDLVLNDTGHGRDYLEELVYHHVSGQLKTAPEHCEDHVLIKMGKPGIQGLMQFKEMFDQMTRAAGKKQYLTYYMIAAHPGCRLDDMKRLQSFAAHRLNIHPEQVQIFTPTPSTYSSLMYYTGIDPFTGRRVFVETHPRGREKQKQIITRKPRFRSRSD